MNIRYLLFSFILIFIINNLCIKEKYVSNPEMIDLYNKTIVRIRTQKKAFNWIEPYINNSSFESIGTGFFIDLEGYIITNYHVINNSLKIYIQIPIYGNKTFDTKLISVYPKLDLALLQIQNFKNENKLELGKSNLLKRGEEVLAVGYPLGQTKIKMTSGIVSGFQNGDIQTDSAINRGNSGGPLIKNNKVIGINYSGYDEAQNVSYAIPVDYFKIVENEMRNNEFIDFPILACTFNNTNEVIMKRRKLCKEGYYISNILSNGTMDLAGVKKGDILCAFDGIPIDNYGELYLKSLDIKFHINDYLKYKKVGDEIDIIIIRDKVNKRLKKKIRLLSNNFYQIRYRYPKYENIDYLIIGGMVIMELANNHFGEEKIEKTTIIKKYDKIEQKTEKKLIITKILKGSKLSEYNIFTAPNILKEVNHSPVYDMDTLYNAIKNVEKDNGDMYMSFLTENDKFYVSELKKIKQEELFLSKELNYEIKPLIKKILNII